MHRDQKPQRPNVPPTRGPDLEPPSQTGDPIPPPDQPGTAPPAEPVRKPPKYA